MDLDLFPDRATDDEIIQQKLTEYNFGSAFMYASQILVAKSSSTFIFYKLQAVPMDDDDDNRQGKMVLQWKQYFTLNMQGFIFFQKGTECFTVVTDKLIYFYRIPKDDGNYIPQLRGTMFNYMQCTGFQLDSSGRIGASFKTNQPNIDIYERKLNHGFHEYIHHESKEGVCG
jgi:hypothetical protein